MNRVMILTQGKHAVLPGVRYPCCKHPPGARVERWCRRVGGGTSRTWEELVTEIEFWFRQGGSDERVGVD